MKIRAAVLGATGIVGQRFVSLLHAHPWFEVSFLAGSDRSAGRRYGEAVRWIIERRLPADIAEMELHPLDAGSIARGQVDVAFTALPADVAQQVEPELARRGVTVVSNSGNMRLDADIPLIVPEINADHLEVIDYQRRKRGWDGLIVKIPNCTTIILALTLKPLLDEFGARRVIASSMQALSGAGLTGVPSVLILDNLIPYIEGEEEKVERESLKILGATKEGIVEPNWSLSVSASCHRVMVLEGHTIAAFVELGRRASTKEVARALEEFRGNKIRGLGLPTAPARPVIVRREEDRPQPRLDRMEGGGMSVVVGRIREDRALGGVKYVALGHNTIRGAAGTGVLIAELLVTKGMI